MAVFNIRIIMFRIIIYDRLIMLTMLFNGRFILAGFFTIQDVTLTVINIVALLIGVVPKLPYFHGFRLQKLLTKDQ